MTSKIIWFNHFITNFIFIHNFFSSWQNDCIGSICIQEMRVQLWPSFSNYFFLSRYLDSVFRVLRSNILNVSNETVFYFQIFLKIQIEIHFMLLEMSAFVSNSIDGNAKIIERFRSYAKMIRLPSVFSRVFLHQWWWSKMCVYIFRHSSMMAPLKSAPSTWTHSAKKNLLAQSVYTK